MQGFFDSCARYVHPEDFLILAISGGVDSMVLLDLMMKHHERRHIIVAHFDHSLRGVESDRDRDFIANFCDKENLTFAVKKMDIAHLAKIEKMSIEAVARKYRYEFLRETAIRYHASSILTAHHLDDRIETMMMNLLRGTKLSGIHALAHHQEISSSIHIIRPLLSSTKSDILEYAKVHGIVYREDSTNTDTKYLRNKIRHDILPEFEAINPEYRRAMSHFIDYSEELYDWIDEEVRAFLGDGLSFTIEDFEKKSSFFQKEVIRSLYERANNGTIGLSEGNIEEMRRYILTAEGATIKNLGTLSLTKKNSRLFFSDQRA